MTNTEKIVVAGAVLLLITQLVISVKLLFTPKGGNLGISVMDASYGSSTITEGTVSCGSAVANGTGSLITNALPGRTLFEVNNTGTNPVHLCRRSNGCTTTSTLMVNPSTTVDHFYRQVDGYGGPYSCVGDNTTSTISYTQSQ